MTFDVAIIGDVNDSQSEFAQKFRLIVGKKLSDNQERRLRKEISYADMVCPPVSYLISNDDYIKYLGKVRKWAGKYRWSTETIVKLLLDPSRQQTGWFSNGGNPMSRYEWEKIKEWIVI